MDMASTGTRKLGEIEARDLSYAVGRLIAAGKTTAAEVVRLAAERGDRIKALEKELAALKDGAVPVAGSATGARRPAKKAAKPKAAKKSPAAKAGKVSTRSDGRKFTTTPKVVAARRAQGQYLGYLRQVPEKGKARIRAIVKEKGVPAAVVEMKKMLAKAKRSGKTAPAARAVAPVARPKKKALPASYYRCAHPGCKNNWFPRGRPYCGEHAKLHGKAKNKK